jgi:hypothetical protein
MPIVPYYLGRPACTVTAALAGPARATAARGAPTSTASPRPRTPDARRWTPDEASAPVPAPASAGAWEAWASNWFTPRQDRTS